MIDSKQIKKMARSIIRHGQAVPGDHRLMHPEREWFVCLLVGIALLAVSGWWAYGQHQRYVNFGQGAGERSPETESIYRRSIVDAGLKVMAERKEANTNFIKSLTQPLPTTTPSPIASTTEAIVAPPAELPIEPPSPETETAPEETSGAPELL